MVSDKGRPRVHGCLLVCSVPRPHWGFSLLYSGGERGEGLSRLMFLDIKTDVQDNVRWLYG